MSAVKVALGGLLGDALAPFARARAETRDGYGAAKALTPPPERRGWAIWDFSWLRRPPELFVGLAYAVVIMLGVAAAASNTALPNTSPAATSCVPCGSSEGCPPATRAPCCGPGPG